MLILIAKIIITIYLWPMMLAGFLGVSNDMMFIATILNIGWIALIITLSHKN